MRRKLILSVGSFALVIVMTQLCSFLVVLLCFGLLGLCASDSYCPKLVPVTDPVSGQTFTYDIKKLAVPDNQLLNFLLDIRPVKHGQPTSISAATHKR